MTTTYVSNRNETVRTEAGMFYLCQRNAGFETNDGRFVVQHLADLYWSAIGTLRQRRGPGRVLGTFDTYEQALAAIDAAGPLPLNDRAVV